MLQKSGGWLPPEGSGQGRAGWEPESQVMNAHRWAPHLAGIKAQGTLLSLARGFMSVLGAYALPDPVLVACRFLTPRPVSLPKAFLWLPGKGLSPWWTICLLLLDKEGLRASIPFVFLSSPLGLPSVAGPGRGNSLHSELHGISFNTL